MSIEMLCKDVRDALKKKGILELTEPQKKAIPAVLAERNILLIAPTGMGKTEAVMLPMFHRLLAGKHKRISLLYITPLRALNRDMLSRMVWFSEYLGIDVAVRHGDTPQKERVSLSKSPPEMLITTPETFQIMFTGKHLREHLRGVKWVIIDEIHELAEAERGAQLAVALERLCEHAEREVQRIGLSATVGSPDEIARFLGGQGRDVEIIQTTLPKAFDIRVEAPLPKTQDEELAAALGTDPEQAASLRRSRALVEEHRSTLFFVNTRDTAEILAARYHIWDEQFPLGVHHGSLSRKVRVQMEEDFKNEALKALICTSSLELGIDVGSADFTIQYNSPRQVTRLIQRIGRAGHRVGETSKGVIIASTHDDIAESSVVARRALSREIEALKIRENPLSVLANQLLAIAVSSRDASLETSFDLVRRAYPFRDLDRETFQRVIDQLVDERVIWIDGPYFGRKRPSFSYFYDNLSMIPDERTYRVVDITTRGVIGTLDEGFVASYVQPHARLIIKGRPWEVVELEEDILVSPSRVAGAVPSWVGEEIPVPFEVAQEVGRIRAKADLGGYPLDEGGISLFKARIDEQKKNFPVPTDRLITIEHDKRTLLVNACLGSKVNETLGTLLSTLLAARIGESVGIRTDPYRIMLELPMPTDPKIVQRLLSETKPESVDTLIRLALRNSSYLRMRMVHVAKKFCAIEKKVDYKKISLKRLMSAFLDTPLFEETVDKVIWEKMDIEKTEETLSRIQAGDVSIEITGLSPIGLSGFEAIRGLIAPQKPDRAVLMTLKRRLEDERIRLLCLSCGSTRTKRIGSLPKKIECENCGAKLVAAVPTYEDHRRLLKKKRHSKKEVKKIKRLYKNANLIFGHGKRAVIALRARGVGPDTAARLLAMFYETEEEFLRAILLAEINYARTRRFWD